MVLVLGSHINKNKTFLDTLKLTKCLNINCLQIMTSSPKNSQLGSISKKEADECLNYVVDNDLFLMTHSKYILNLASPKAWVHHAYSVQLENAYKIGGSTSVIHLGKQCKMSYDEAYKNTITNIKKTIKKVFSGAGAKEKKKYLRISIETSSGQGSEMLTRIEELGQLYKKFTAAEKKLITFVIDTCHIFAAGYDIRTKKGAEDYWKKWNKEIGKNRVIAIHLNDSLNPLASRKDRHGQFGKGYITNPALGGSPEGIKEIIRIAKEKSIPLILERGSETITDIKKELDYIKKNYL